MWIRAFSSWPTRRWTKSECDRHITVPSLLYLILQCPLRILGGFVLEFEDRLVDKSDSKKNEEYAELVSKLERDLLG